MFELSEAAYGFLDGFDCEQVTADEVAEAASEFLVAPGDSFWHDSELWRTHTLMFGTPDITQTEDYLFDYSNYQVALDTLSEKYPGDVEDAGFGHWTYSKFVCVKVRVLDEDGRVTAAFAHAYDMVKRAEEYPILDEQHYMELESRIQDDNVKWWAEYNNVDADAVFKAWQDDVVYVEGVGSGFTILGGNGETDGEDWADRDQIIVDLIRAHTEAEAANV